MQCVFTIEVGKCTFSPHLYSVLLQYFANIQIGWGSEELKRCRHAVLQTFKIGLLNFRNSRPDPDSDGLGFKTICLSVARSDSGSNILLLNYSIKLAVRGGSQLFQR